MVRWRCREGDVKEWKWKEECTIIGADSLGFEASAFEEGRLAAPGIGWRAAARADASTPEVERG